MTTSPLRVAIDATPLLGPRTGIGTVVDNLVTSLGHDTSLSLTGIVVSWRGGRDLHRVLPAGVAPKMFYWPARGAQRMWRSVDFPRLTGFDLVHGTNFVSPPAGGSPELITIHDFTAWRFPEIVSEHSRAYPTLVQRALKRGAHVHCVSNFVADEAAEYLKLTRERIHTVVNGFDSAAFAAGLPDHAGEGAHSGPSAPRRYVLAIGTEEPRKDYPTLVKAMESVWSSVGEVRLIIAGSPGWGSDAIDHAVDCSPRPELIERRGYVSDGERMRLLANASILAYPSRYEGFGLPLLEAMAASVPVVATKTGSIPEVAGDAALLVGPEDAEDLGATMATVLEDERLRERLIGSGLQRCQQYPAMTAATQMADLYRQIVESNAS